MTRNPVFLYSARAGALEPDTCRMIREKPSSASAGRRRPKKAVPKPFPRSSSWIWREDRQTEETPAACTCAEKSQAGAVNTVCPVCAVNMSECAGKALEVEPEPEPEPEKESGSGGALVLILLLAALGGGAFAYIKFIKPKQGAKVSADPDDYEFEDEEYENEDVPEQEEQEDQN